VTSTILVIVGVFLILVGVSLLIVKRFQTSESDTNKPTLQGPMNTFAISGPAGLVVIVIGVVCIVLPTVIGVNRSAGSSPSSISSPAPSSISSSARPTVSAVPSTSPGPVITVESPTHNLVSRRVGFVAKGSVSRLGAHTIWLFDYNGSDFYIDVKATVSSDGSRWSAADYPLGSASQSLPFEVTVLVVVATPECTSTLQAKVRSDETKLSKLPVGCHAVQPSIAVTVNRE